MFRSSVGLSRMGIIPAQQTHWIVHWMSLPHRADTLQAGTAGEACGGLGSAGLYMSHGQDICPSVPWDATHLGFTCLCFCSRSVDLALAEDAEL